MLPRFVFLTVLFALACSSGDNPYANACNTPQTFSANDAMLNGTPVPVSGMLLTPDCVRLCQPTPASLPADWSVRTCRVRARRGDTVDLDCNALPPTCP
jgi:hypothetical protein